MEELELDYNVRVDNMVHIEGQYEKFGWIIEKGDFYSDEGKIVVMSYLLNKSKRQQIFKMDDGRFVLETENEDEVDYFYSYDIEDLL